MMRMTHLVPAALIVGAIGYVGVAAYSLKRMPTSHLAICASEEQVAYVPSSVCRWYLLDYRLGPQAVAEIEAVGGVDFLLNVDGEHGYDIADAFLAEGLYIEAPAGGPGGATPLQAAVLYGDPERVKYLLAKGADARATSDRLPFAPLELAQKLAEEGKLKEGAVLELLQMAVENQPR